MSNSHIIIIILVVLTIIIGITVYIMKLKKSEPAPAYDSLLEKLIKDKDKDTRMQTRMQTMFRSSDYSTPSVFVEKRIFTSQEILTMANETNTVPVRIPKNTVDRKILEKFDYMFRDIIKKLFVLSGCSQTDYPTLYVLMSCYLRVTLKDGQKTDYPLLCVLLNNVSKNPNQDYANRILKDFGSSYMFMIIKEVVGSEFIVYNESTKQITLKNGESSPFFISDCFKDKKIITLSEFENCLNLQWLKEIEKDLSTITISSYIENYTFCNFY